MEVMLVWIVHVSNRRDIFFVKDEIYTCETFKVFFCLDVLERPTFDHHLNIF